MKKILVTGAFGQIGSELVPTLQDKHGRDMVVAMGHSNIPSGYDGLLEKLDILDKEGIEKILDKHEIGVIYHLVSILSANGEKMPHETWDVNMEGLKNVLDLSVERGIQVFWPSSIAAFGPTTPRDDTPQRTVLEPTTMYGVTKAAGEDLCHYYHLKFGLDVRSVRYPGLISWKTPPGGGTTDYAVAIYYEAVERGKYECFVHENTVLPMMYMDDAIAGTIKLMEADPAILSVRTSYNMAGMSFSAKELAESVNKVIPVEVTYKSDSRQKIADSWPKSIDDSQAREDWGWAPTYDLDRMSKVMVESLKKKLKS